MLTLIHSRGLTIIEGRLSVFFYLMLVKRVEPPQGGSQSLCSWLPRRTIHVSTQSHGGYPDATPPARVAPRGTRPVRSYPSLPSFEPYKMRPCPAHHLRLHSTCPPFLHRPSFLPLRAPQSPAVRICPSFFSLPLCAVCSISQLAACLRPHCSGIWKFLQSFVASEVIGILGAQLVVCRLLHLFSRQPLHRSFCISFRDLKRFAVLFVVFFVG